MWPSITYIFYTGAPPVKPDMHSHMHSHCVQTCSLITNLPGKPQTVYFPHCDVGGFTPLTSLVAAEKDEIFSVYASIFFKFRDSRNVFTALQ